MNETSTDNNDYRDSAFLYSNRGPPPSSFTYSFPFPFQAYAGNPDPGMAIPGLSSSRRSASFESMNAAVQRSYRALGLASAPLDANIPRSGSLSDLSTSRRAGTPPSPVPVPSPVPAVFQNSAAAHMMPSTPPLPASGNAQLPRSASTQTFRAPFLSPTSRPSSSLWSPPTPSYSLPALTAGPNDSASALPPPPPPLPKKTKPPLPSTLLAAPLAPADKPWTLQREPRAGLAWWVTVLCIVFGVAGAVVLSWDGVRQTKSRMLNPAELCLVMDEQFSGPELDTSRWSKDIELGGFGNNEFQMTTSSSKNLYIKDGQLYIFPTLSSDDPKIGDVLKDGAKYTLSDCTASIPAPPPPANSTNGRNGTSTTHNAPAPTGGNGNGNTGGRNPATGSQTNRGRALASHSHWRSPPLLASRAGVGPGNVNRGNGTACTAITSDALGTVVNPVMSARITTKGKVGMRFGRVEVRARLPRGDWLWPAVWMLPENNTYGPWPLSGEIDILEARGNAPSYPAQGTNYVRSSLNYGLASTLTPITSGKDAGLSLTKQLFGWYSLKHSSFDRAFHTYALEWDESFLRFYVDSRVRDVLQISVANGVKGAKSFWERGKFPATAQNGSSAAVVVKNPWEGRGPVAPFDQRFYLIIDLAVGGTSGWFPDNKGGKPWYDASLTAMRDFARAQDQWFTTWPQSDDERAFRIDYIKMWSKDC